MLGSLSGHCFGCMCHRHGIQVKEKMVRFRCIYSIQGFWCGCKQMCRQMVMFTNVHAQWFSCLKIKADDCDIIK